MEHTRELLEQTGGAAPVAGSPAKDSGLRSVQDLESVINEGLRAALLEESPDQSLEVLLEHMGKALNGERTYIFERNELGGDDNTYEWVVGGGAGEGAAPESSPGGVRQLVPELPHQRTYCY